MKIRTRDGFEIDLSPEELRHFNINTIEDLNKAIAMISGLRKEIIGFKVGNFNLRNTDQKFLQTK